MLNLKKPHTGVLGMNEMRALILNKAKPVTLKQPRHSGVYITRGFVQLIHPPFDETSTACAAARAVSSRLSKRCIPKPTELAANTDITTNSASAYYNHLRKWKS